MGGIRFVVAIPLVALPLLFLLVSSTGCAFGGETEITFGDPFIPTGGISTGSGSTDIGGSTFSAAMSA